MEAHKLFLANDHTE